MGRLPETFGGRKITYRIPYVIEQRVTVTPGEQGSTFVLSHNVDKPFEIHRLIPRAYRANNFTTESAMYEVTIDLLDITRNQPLTKQPTLLASLVKGTVENTWEWGEPYYLERAEGIQAILGSIQPTPNPGGLQSFVHIVLEGFLLVIPPASDRRG